MDALDHRGLPPPAFATLTGSPDQATGSAGGHDSFRGVTVEIARMPKSAVMAVIKGARDGICTAGFARMSNLAAIAAMGDVIRTAEMGELRLLAAIEGDDVEVLTYALFLQADHQKEDLVRGYSGVKGKTDAPLCKTLN